MSNLASGPIGPCVEQYPVVAGNAAAPVNVAEYERYAKNTLPRNAHDYYGTQLCS